MNHVNQPIIGGDIVLPSINVVGMFSGLWVGSSYFPKGVD
jgi:hypothetical protein